MALWTANLTNDTEHYLSGQHPPMGEQLIATGLATSVQVERALQEQRQTGERLGEILIAHGILYEADLARTLAAMFQLPYRDLSLELPDPAALRQIPEAFCRSRNVLPVAIEANAVVVALADPRDIQTRDDLRMMASMPVRPVVVAPDQLRRALETAFQGTGFEPEVEGPDGEATGPSRASDTSTIGETSNIDISGNVDPSQSEGPVITIVNQLIRRAAEERASDLHLEPTGEGLRVRFRVDGILHDVTILPASLQQRIISRVKIMAGMDIADHRRPQDGRISIVSHELPVDIRAASLPTNYGEALVLRLLQKDQGLLEIGRLGFVPDAFGRYEESYQKAWGMVLVTGPTGSGKTTTLYATVNELNETSRNIITVEDPIEYRVAGIKQTQVNVQAGYTFASGLRAALRADPDIVLIGEIRDLETARIGAESALTGHLVLSTLHANNAASSTTRLIEMGLEPYLVTSALECVVAQRLLRRLCGRCRIAEPASPEELLELATMSLIDDPSTDVTLYRANGCAQCGQRGYQGRLAVHEVLVMNDELKALVLERAPAHAIALAAVAGGMQTLQRDAFAKVLSGETTIEECKRVLK